MSRDKLTLRECNREDLIWIINRLLKHLAFSKEDYHLQRVLNELWYEKEKKRIDEAEEVAKLADAKLEEFTEVLKPYDGKTILDIPEAVLKKAQKLREEWERLNRKWLRMMDIGGKK